MTSPQPLPTSVSTGPLAAYDGYIYTIGGDNNLYKLSTTVAIPNGTAIPILDVSAAVGIQFITIYFNPNTNKKEMYISAVGNNFNGSGAIYFISDLDNPVLTTFVTGLDSPRGLQVDGGFLYVITVSIGPDQLRLFSFDLTYSFNQFVLTLVSTFFNSQQLVIVGSNCYILNNDNPPNCYITQVDISFFSPTSNYNLTWASLNTLGSLDPALVYNNNFLYVAYINNGLNYIAQISIDDQFITNNNYFPSLVSTNTEFYSIVILNNNFFIDFYFLSAGGSYDFTIYGLPIYANVPCFKEDTKILTDKGYILIKDLRKGDLVKTIKHDYVAINMIGKREIYHPASSERIKDQLYKCSKSEYPEIIEDLVITGCHCILVDNFTNDEQKQKVIEINKKIYITDNKYRLPACADLRASVYETSGSYTIYHLALENDNYYMNYGIYANGLLVETCSKRYLKELSNMTLIE